MVPVEARNKYPKFVIAATVDDISLKTNAKFKYRILDNENYEIDEFGGVSAVKGYEPQKGDKFTVEVRYIPKYGRASKKIRTYTVGGNI